MPWNSRSNGSRGSSLLEIGTLLLILVLPGTSSSAQAQVIEDFEGIGDYPYGYAFIRPCSEGWGENLTVVEGAGVNGSYGAVFSPAISRWYVEEEGVSTGPGNTYSVKVRFPSGFGTAWFGVGADAVSESGLQVCSSGAGAIIAGFTPGFRLTLSDLDNFASASPATNCPFGPCVAFDNDAPFVDPNTWYRLQIRWLNDGTARAEFLEDDGCETLLAVTPYAAVTPGGAGYTIKGDGLDGVIMDDIAETSCLSPNITTQPVDQEACECESASFGVVACGNGPFTYQWYRNGEIMDGSTNQTLILDPVEPDDFGDNFNVLVTNACGSTTYSNTAELIGLDHVEIQQPGPVDVVQCDGSAANFTVTATGSPPLTYSWTGTGIFGPADGPSITAIPPAPGTYFYNCTVTNECLCGQASCPACQATGAFLTWLDLGFHSDPQGGFYEVGATLQLTVDARDAETYQWQRKTGGGLWNPVLNGGRISGADTDTLQISSFEDGDAGLYRVHIANTCNPAGIESKPARIQRPNKLFAVLLGGTSGGINGEIDTYDVRTALLRFPGVKAANLYFARTSTAAITHINTIKQQVQPGDSFIFFYAGHGGVNTAESDEPLVEWSDDAKEAHPPYVSDTGDEYLAVNSQQYTNPSSDIILDDELKDAFLDMDGVHKLAILSSCFSGGFWGQPGNVQDEGDLEKVPGTAILTAAVEGDVSYAYRNIWDGGDHRTHFGEAVANALNDLANEQSTFSFAELRDAVEAQYVNGNFPTQGIIADGEPWLDTEDPPIVDVGTLNMFWATTSDFDSDAILGGCNSLSTSDLDGDSVRDLCDNCPSMANPAQEDCDRDNEGDICDVTFVDCQEDGLNDACQLDSSSEITQSSSLGDTGQVACSGTNCTGSNWWARCFDLPTDAVIDGLTFGVSATSNLPPSGSWQVEVNLYADNDAACPPGQTETATLLRQVTMSITSAEIGQQVTATLAPPLVVEAGTALIAEVGTPVDGCSLGSFSFRTTANNGGQTGPSYLRAADCGFTAWIDHATIGAANAHTVMSLETVVAGGNDQNGNGIPDECEFPDCDLDNIADADEIANCNGDPGCADCNNNLIPDACDIADCASDPGCADCDGNLIPDGCELDCNANDIADACDLSSGSSEDCQSDDIPDECQLSGTLDVSQNASMALENRLACSNQTNDCTSDNWWARCFALAQPTIVEGVTFGVAETNGPPPTGTWQIKARLWRDNDAACPPGTTANATLLGESIVTIANSQVGQLVTAAFSPPIAIPSGTALIVEVGSDQDGCSIGVGIKFMAGANGAGQTGPSYLRSSSCGLPNWTSFASLGFPTLHQVLTLQTVVPNGNDQNENGIPDECEFPDCDDDNISDDEEIANCNGDPGCDDCNSNLIPDGCDIADCASDPACADCNSNLIPDGCESDCNSNEVPDACDISSGSSEDCQSDAVPDDCQLASTGQMTQSAALNQTSQLACSNSGSNCTDVNWWGRCFPITSAIGIQGVQFRVLEANGPPPTGIWQIQANLWRDNDNACPPGTLANATQIGQTTVAVSSAQVGQLVTAIFNPPVNVPAGTALIAEVGTPLSGCSVGTGIRFRTGANTGAQTGPSYIRSSACAFNNWTDYATIGFANLRTVMVLNTLIPNGNDQNNNQVPDECDIEAPGPVTPDPSGFDKSRFISFVLPATSTGETAIRVQLVSLHHVDPPYTGGPSVPFTSFEGQSRWVGPPTSYVESTASGTPFFAAYLQCTPHYRDWSTVGLLHVTGSAITPSSLYDVEHVAASCQGIEASCGAVSAPLAIATTRWGDVESPFNPPSPSTQPDLGDISALVNKFRSAPGAPIKARALLVGTDAVGTIDIVPDLNFNHIGSCVDAFRGRPYPHTFEACP